QVLRFAPPGGGNRPAVILVHGCDGGTQMWAYRFAAEGLVQTGHVAILIRYYDRTKTPDKVQPEQQMEFSRWLKGEFQNDEASKHFDQWVATISDAVAYARGLDGVDATRVGIAGFSFGGYLAAAAAPKCDPPVGAVVNMFGGLAESTRKHL